MVDTARHAASADVDDRADEGRKPDEPTDLTKRSWRYVLKRTVSEFSSDQCTDLAAALTYYAVMAVFPGLLALVSILGIVGANNTQTRNTILDVTSCPRRRPAATRWRSGSRVRCGRRPGTSAPSAGR